MEIQLRHKKHWLYEWKPIDYYKWYPINRERIFHPVNEEARNMFNALISGLIVTVLRARAKTLIWKKVLGDNNE